MEPQYSTVDISKLIEWCHHESILAVKTGQDLDAEVLQKSVASLIDIGQLQKLNDSRLNQWLDFRLTEIIELFEDYKSLALGIEKSHMLKSLLLLSKFVESCISMDCIKLSKPL